MEYRYHHIHIQVTDMAKAVEFYQRAFGAVVDHQGHWQGRTTTAIDIGGVRVLLSDRPYPLDAPVKKGIWEPHLGMDHLSFTVPHLDAACRDLKAKGVEFLMEPHEMRPGVRVAYVKAPDNVRIELLERRE